MSPTDSTPDFDNMSPEEIMLWMESLAKRQGANEGFTTNADQSIPEIDPDSVVIDEPGYIPYGEEERVRKTGVSAPPPAAPPPVAPPPVPVPEPLFQLPPQPIPAPPPQPIIPEPAAETPIESAIGENALAWLESLAADNGMDTLSLDLSTLEPEPAVRPTPTDPQDWLRNLAAEPDLPAPTPEPTAAPGDPMDWLEKIASNQVPPEEERITDAWTSVPPNDVGNLFGAHPPAAQPEPLNLENPQSLLDSFALDAGFEDDAVRAAPEARRPVEDDMSLESIQRAIAEGRVTPEQMKRFQEYQMERAAQRTDVVDEDEFDPDAPAEPTELPEWLAGMKPVEEPPVAEAPTNLPPIEMLFGQPLPTETTEPIPSWLQDDGSEAETIENIFAAEPPKTAASIELDENDPWIEALDEQFGQAVDDEQVPDWYLRNTTDPRRIAAIEGTVPVDEPAPQAAPSAPEVPMIQVIHSVQLADAALPSETSLPAGERQALPPWMSVTSTQTAPQVSPTAATIPAQEAPAPVEAEPLPDWLKTDEHPMPNLDWLTPEAEEPANHFEFEPVPEPVTIVTAPPPPPPPPVAPLPPPVVTTGALEEARQRYKSGDLKGSLALYEALVRTSQSLTEVASDLTTVAQSQKDPVLFRVLGDSLMRQGRLQDALNIYRQALNLL